MIIILKLSCNDVTEYKVFFRAAVDGFGQELLAAVPAEERKKLRYEQTSSAMFDKI